MTRRVSGRRPDAGGSGRMSPFLAVFLVLVLGSTSYAAGRLHGQLSYRIGYRFGYRQGYFDGDRGAWNRRRRDAQAAIASALAGPPPASAAPRPAPVAGRYPPRSPLRPVRPGRRRPPRPRSSAGSPPGRAPPTPGPRSAARSRRPARPGRWSAGRADGRHRHGASSAADAHRRDPVRPVTVVPPAGMRAGGMHPGRFRRAACPAPVGCDPLSPLAEAARRG